MPYAIQQNSKSPFFTLILLLVLAGITAYTMFYRGKSDDATLIAEDISKLSRIFERIDEQCEIIDFENQKNPINFLNVKKDGFAGSMVGPMNLAYPENWQGPYMVQHPTYGGIDYQIVRTDAGYFIAPGDGVTLPNGKVIGKDIMLDEKADIEKLMKDDQGLMYKGKAFAAPLMLVPQEHNINFEEEMTAEELI